MAFASKLNIILESGPDRRGFLKAAISAAAAAAAPGSVVGAATTAASTSVDPVKMVIGHVFGSSDFFNSIVHHFNNKRIVNDLRQGRGVRLEDLVDDGDFIDELIYHYADQNPPDMELWTDIGLYVDTMRDVVLKTPVKKEQLLSILTNSPIDLFRIYVNSVSEGNAADGKAAGLMRNLNDLFGGFFQRFERELISKIGPQDFVRDFIKEFEPSGGMLGRLKSSLYEIGSRHREIFDILPRETLKPGNEERLVKTLDERGLADKRTCKRIQSEVDWHRENNNRIAKLKQAQIRAAADDYDRDAELSRWEGEGGSVIEQKLNRYLNRLRLI